MRSAYISKAGASVVAAWTQDVLWPQGQDVAAALEQLEAASQEELDRQVQAFWHTAPADGRAPRRMIAEEVFDEIPEVRRTLAREWLTRQGASPEEREAVLRPLQRAWLLLKGKRPAQWSADDILGLLMRGGQGPRAPRCPVLLATRALWLSQGDRKYPQRQLQRLGEFLARLAEG